MEKKKIILIVLIGLWVILAITPNDSRNINEVGLDDQENLKSSGSIYFTINKPSEINETISQLYNYKINVTDDSGSWNYKAKIWQNNPTLYSWNDMSFDGSNLIYSIDPIDYNNGYYNITVKCQYQVFPELWDNDTIQIYIINERPEINVTTPSASEIITQLYDYEVNTSIADKEGNIFNVSIAMFNTTNDKILGWDSMINYTSTYYNYSFDPISFDNGDYKLSIRANDTKGYNYNNISITILNEAPNITFVKPDEHQIIIIKKNVIINVSIIDDESNPLTNTDFCIYNSSWVRVVDWTPLENYFGDYFNNTFYSGDLTNGDYTIIIRASDPKYSVTKDISITINIPIDNEGKPPDDDDDSSNDDDSPDPDESWIITAIISGIISALASISVKIGYSRMKKKKQQLQIRAKTKSPKPKLPKKPKKNTDKYSHLFEFEDNKNKNTDKNETDNTEKEISVQKSEFTCLVHKGLIVKDIYVCPKCLNTYCHTCVNTLYEKGENCWYCNTPFKTNNLPKDEKNLLLSEIPKKEFDPIEFPDIKETKNPDDIENWQWDED